MKICKIQIPFLQIIEIFFFFFKLSTNCHLPSSKLRICNCLQFGANDLLERFSYLIKKFLYVTYVSSSKISRNNKRLDKTKNHYLTLINITWLFEEPNRLLADQCFPKI